MEIDIESFKADYAENKRCHLQALRNNMTYINKSNMYDFYDKYKIGWFKSDKKVKADIITLGIYGEWGIYRETYNSIEMSYRIAVEDLVKNIQVKNREIYGYDMEENKIKSIFEIKKFIDLVNEFIMNKGSLEC